jgi:hypothetical protein
MKKIISYCLFETKNINQRLHRDWDKYRNEMQRYWYNIPSVYIINSLIFDDFDMRIYISSNVKENPLYPLLNTLNKQNNFNLYVSNANYNNTEPTMWRMIPFWGDVDVLLCRDIDSLPTKQEIQATKEFLDSGFLIHTMRTHNHHNQASTNILAGLCGFKPKEIMNESLISVNSFKEYYGFSNGSWGCDQNTLIELFYNRIEDKKKYFLDSALSSDVHKVHKKEHCGYIDHSIYKIKDYNEIIEYIDQYTVWSGEPIDFRKEKLEKLLDYDLEPCKVIKEIFDKNPDIKDFYLK